MMRFTIFFLFSSLASGFVIIPNESTSARQQQLILYSKDDGSSGDVVVLQQALQKGTLVEFEEKGRVHIGTIKSSEHKSSGGARYKVEDTDGKAYNIADKAVTFSTPAPNSDNKADQLLTQLASLQTASEDDLCNKLDVSPELLEMAWEEAADDDVSPNHELTAKSFIKLVHSHAASAVEEYMAWKLLKTEMSHVFFKEMKQHGRVLSFKAKTRKAVDNAKTAFCANHDAEFCFI